MQPSDIGNKNSEKQKQIRHTTHYSSDKTNTETNNTILKKNDGEIIPHRLYNLQLPFILSSWNTKTRTMEVTQASWIWLP